MELGEKIIGNLIAPVNNIAIVASRFNELVVDRLVSGACDTLMRHGLKKSQIEIFQVPGAFEIPMACQQLAQTNRYAGIVALGTVIRGETAHFEYVAGSCAQGVQQAQLASKIPMTFGVLTTENLEQALARAGGTVGNKGSEAAAALLEMINLLGKINND